MLFSAYISHLLPHTPNRKAPTMSQTIVLPAFALDQPAARVDTALREALAACDRARECAVLWFAEVQRRGLHREFGYASLELYATQGLGFSLNRYWQFKRLADDLERLPALREAVATGELGWTKAQQVARVATPQTQAAWVARAAVAGRRELAGEVRAAREGVRREAAAAAGRLDGGRLFGEAVAADVPIAVAPARVEVTVTLRGDALQAARFEALLARARKLRLGAAGAGRLELVLEALAALVGGDGVAPSGAASGSHGGVACDEQDKRGASTRRPVQIIVQRCPECEAAAVTTSRGELRLAPAQVEQVACDARVREEGVSPANRATIPPRVRAQVLARDRHRCATAGCGASRFLEVHHVVPRARGGSNEAGNLVTLCSRCHAFVHEHALLPAGRGVTIS